MPDLNQNYSSGNSEPQVPPAPSGEVGIRTMDSDLQSFKQSGGVESSPDIIKFPAGGSSSLPPNLPAEANFQFDQGNGGDTPSFTPPGDTGGGASSVVGGEGGASSSQAGGKKIFLIILKIIVTKNNQFEAELLSGPHKNN
jgi:hypothetical protein